MGTDVHAVWQVRKDGKWVDVASTWEQDRHYLLFSWLANVRNGFGFAGVPTYNPIEPIARPRGLPADFTGGEDHPLDPTTIPESHQKWYDGATTIWLGDHTHSWLSSTEILAAKRPARVQHTGVVPLSWYQSWDKVTPPTEWSGGISGRGIHVAAHPSQITDKTTHVQIEWDSGDELDYFVAEVQRLHELHGEVRLVFGFDS